MKIIFLLFTLHNMIAIVTVSKTANKGYNLFSDP